MQGRGWFTLFVLLAAASEALGQAQPGRPSPPAGALPEGGRATLAEAVSIALTQHTSMAAAGRNVSIAQSRELEARSAQTPRVTATAELDRSYSGKGIGFGGTGGTSPFGVHSEQHRALIALRQNFFDTFQTSTRVRQARAGVSAARSVLSATRQNLVLNVTAAYLAVLRAKELRAVADLALSRARTELERVRALVAAESLAAREILRAEADVAAAQVDVIRATTAVDDARALLKNTMGVPQGTPIDTAETLSAPEAAPPLETLVREALRLRPEVAEARFRVEGAEAGLRLARIQKGPVLSVDGAADLQVHPNPLSRAWSLVAAVGFPLFDIALTRARVREAEAALDISRLDLEQAERDVALQVTQAHLAHQEALARINAAQAAVTAARANLEAQIGSLEAGVVILLEVTQAREQLRQAESELVTALHDAIVALARLNQAVGRDPSLGISLAPEAAGASPAAGEAQASPTNAPGAAPAAPEPPAAGSPSEGTPQP